MYLRNIYVRKYTNENNKLIRWSHEEYPVNNLDDFGFALSEDNMRKPQNLKKLVTCCDKTAVFTQ